MPALLELQGLVKRYGAAVVIDDVSLEVAEGEALGIIGPNGAGKSTLFNLVAGGVPADAGRVRFVGRDISALPPHARARAGIGRSYQIPQPFGAMSVYENLLVGAVFAGRGRVGDPRGHCLDTLARTGLLARANQPAGSLTLLERKRLELSRALAGRPRLLLLDEIAGGLTEAESQALVQTIRGVHAAGTTIVWVEHVLHALLPVVSRLVVLASGRLLATGAPDAVLADPQVRAVYLGRDADLLAA
jgi:branched-chain amino acid transport system ATP-binding protein